MYKRQAFIRINGEGLKDAIGPVKDFRGVEYSQTVPAPYAGLVDVYKRQVLEHIDSIPYLQSRLDGWTHDLSKMTDQTLQSPKYFQD